MTRYINMRTNWGVETIDEFPYNTHAERKEFNRCLSEYRLAGMNVYPSRRCTQEWKEK